jgi:hypothetical protein
MKKTTQEIKFGQISGAIPAFATGSNKNHDKLQLAITLIQITHVSSNFYPARLKLTLLKHKYVVTSEI